MIKSSTKPSSYCSYFVATSLVIPDSGSANGDVSTDEEALPMIQLASFALHKLFSEWEYDGHKVPQLKPATLSVRTTNY